MIFKICKTKSEANKIANEKNKTARTQHYKVSKFHSGYAVLKYQAK